MSRPMRMPDFAGTALVDILANGLAMLIIVIVLSIAARGEREQRTASQVEEVETMMSRRFSTSLVLNSLAASAPAQLHDYRNSPLDQQYDPQTLPIIELHRDFVREFYSGSIWRREALAREPNVMDDWLTRFDPERKLRLRVDIYDIAQFYLAMSILRDHEITVQHWHFLAGGLGLAQAGKCPPGIAAQDCVGGMGGSATGISALPTLAQGSGAGDSWPPADFPGGGGKEPNAELSPFPGGAALGPLSGFMAGTGSGIGGTGLIPGIPGLGDGSMFGSFPNARPGTGSQTSGLSGLPGQKGGERMRFRLSSPDSLFQDNQAFSWGDTKPSVSRILAALFDVTGRLQARLDAGVSPSPLLANFEALLSSAFLTPATLDEDTHNMISDLAWGLSLTMAYDSFLGASGTSQEPPLRIIPQALEEGAKTALMIAPNRQLQEVFLGQAGPAAKPLYEGRLILGLNTHPDVWRGLSLSLEWHAILLMPKQMAPEAFGEGLRWRAVAYIAPGFDDFIIGFTYASIDEEGRLVVPAEDNRVRLGGRPLRTSSQEPGFGTRDWLVSLYVLLLICILGFGFLVRYLIGRRPG